MDTETRQFAEAVLSSSSLFWVTAACFGFLAIMAALRLDSARETPDVRWTIGLRWARIDWIVVIVGILSFSTHIGQWLLQR
jgi:hypothetical protein